MAQTAEQLQTRIDNIRAAIDRAIQAQSYSVAGRQHVNQALKELRSQEKSYVLQLSRLTTGAAFVSDFSHSEGY